MSLSEKLQPITASFSLKDHIHDVLRDAIMDMKIYDDATDLRLDERSLAEKLGISRTPVREALTRLERDGFVDILPRRGVFVKRKSLEEVLEMVVLWAALESMAARLVTERASDEELLGLKQLAADYSTTDAGANIEEYSDANIRFHQRILTLSQCNLLKSTADGLFLHMHAVRRRTMGESDRAKKSVVDHAHIIEALERRDATLASDLVREHTMKLHDHIKTTWTKLEQEKGRTTK